MTSAAMNRLGQRLAWQLQVVWARLGMVELLLLAALVLWAGLQWQVIRPLQAMHADAVQKRETLAQEAALLQPASARLVMEDPVAAFARVFPPHTDREKQIDRLHVLAGASGVSIERIDYRVEALQALPLQRMGLRFSASGSYEAQRKFLHDFLKTFGNAAVERVSLEKEKNSLQQLLVQFDAGFYYRDAP